MIHDLLIVLTVGVAGFYATGWMCAVVAGEPARIASLRFAPPIVLSAVVFAGVAAWDRRPLYVALPLLVAAVWTAMWWHARRQVHAEGGR